MNNEKVAANTAATSYEFVVGLGVPATVGAKGLAGAEVVEVQKKMGSTDYMDVGVQLTVAEPVKIIKGVGEYKLNKGVTAGAVSLHFENQL